MKSPRAKQKVTNALFGGAGSVRYNAFVDINADGYTDIMSSLTYDGSHYMEYFEGNGDGSFKNVVLTGESGNFTYALADVNNDGHDDMLYHGYLMVAGPGPNGTIVQLTEQATPWTHQVRLANGTFQSSTIPFDVTPTFGDQAVVGDFNGDAFSDVLWHNSADFTYYLKLGNGDGTFKASNSLSPGVATGGMLAADFDDNGTLDLFSSEGYNAGVFLSGNGDGTFFQAASLSLPSTQWAETADLDGDGNLDLVTRCYSNPNHLEVRYGNGDFTFTGPTTYLHFTDAWAFELADLNGDNRADIVATGYSDRSVNVLLNAGGRSFTTASVGQYLTPQHARDIAVADFDEDGFSDIAAIDSGANLTLFFGNGDGSFSAPAVTALQHLSNALTAADLNADGNIDLVLDSGNSSGSAAVMFGDGAGGFGQVTNLGLTVATGEQTSRIALTDFDRNGALDIVTGGRIIFGNSDLQYDSVWIPPSGNGTYTEYITRWVDENVTTRTTTWTFQSSLGGTAPLGVGSSAAPNGNLQYLTHGDYNGDGETDLLFNWEDSGIRMLGVAAGNGDGTFGAVTTVRTNVSLGFGVAGISDFQGDGRGDLIAADTTGIYTYLANADGTFSETLDSGKFLVGSDILSAASVSSSLGDFNGDGRVDAFVYDGVGTYSVAAGSVTGGFDAPHQTLIVTGQEPFAHDVDDYDLDGNADVLLTLNGETLVFLGNGDGFFQAARQSSGVIESEIYTGDFDGDGYRDLVAKNGAFSNLVMKFGNGDGTFKQSVSFDVSPVGAVMNGDLAVLDLNHDGVDDLVTVETVGTELVTFFHKGLGDGTFFAAQTMGLSGYALDTFDANNDGEQDVVTLATNGGTAVSYVSCQTGPENLFKSPFNAPYSATNPLTTIGDVNNDGKQDLVAYSTAGIEASLGNGDGSFGAAFTVSNYGLWDAHLKDIDNDGKFDLVGTGSSSNDPLVFFGNGDGSFSAPTSYPYAGAGAVRLWVDDFDQDGDYDLLNNQGQFFRGAGGTFAAPLSSFASYIVEVADLDGDGADDLIEQLFGTVNIRLGNGDGTWQSAVSYTVNPLHVIGTNRDLAEAKDFDGDGELDLIVNDFSQGHYLLHGNGDGTFAAAQTLDLTFQSLSGMAYDLNEDGKQDLILNDPDSGLAYVAFGNGNGTFNMPTTIAASGATSPFVLAHLNGPGRLDLVAGRSIFLADDSYSFADPVVSSVAIGTYYSGTAGDFNNDGIQDAVSNIGQLYLSIGNGNGSFQNGINIDASPVTWKVSSADLDDDGNRDVVYDTNTSRVVRYGNGDGTFQAGVTIDGAPVSNVPGAMGDLDGNGTVDLLVETSFTSLGVRFSNGDGTFADVVTVSFDHASSPTLGALIADVTGDGINDLIVEGGRDLQTFVSNGDGTFKSGVTAAITTGSRAYRLRSADLDNDGDKDLVYRTLSSDTVFAAFGNGNGTFSAVISFAIDPFGGSGELQQVEVLDLDSDGNQDLVTVQQNGQNYYAYFSAGNGDGTFQAAGMLQALGSSGGVVQVDLNDDGEDDLVLYDMLLNSYLAGGRPAVVTGEGTWTSVSTVTNTNWHHEEWKANGTFDDFTAVGTEAVGVRAARAGDFNGDGKLDVLMADSVGNAAMLMLGNGDGTYQAMTTVANWVGLDYEVVDINGDNLLDIGAGSSYFLGNGNGTFSASRTITSVTDGTGFTYGDVNKDGRLDVVTSGRLYLANADGSYSAGLDPYGAGSFNMPVLADVDGDTNLDLVGADGTTGLVFLGNGNGTFGAALSQFAIGANTKTINVANVIGDSHRDIVVTDMNSDTVMAFAGAGNGTFGSAVTLLSENGVYKTDIGDLNADGLDDLAVRYYTVGAGTKTVLLMNNGDGTFGRQTFTGEENHGGGTVELVDLDKNSALDVLISMQGSGVRILFGNSDVQFDEVVHNDPGGGGGTTTDIARAPSNPLDNTLTTRAGGTVAYKQLKKFQKAIKSDLKDLNEILSEIMAARSFAMEGMRSAEAMEQNALGYRDATSLAQALVARIRANANDSALAAHSDLDRTLASALGL